MTDLEIMKAAFAAKGGTVSVQAEGIAYGVNKDADKVKRAEAREDRSRERSREGEAQRAENYFQQEREVNGYYRS